MKKYANRRNRRTVSANRAVRNRRRIMASTAMSTDEMWDYLHDCVGVSEETLRVVTDILGYNEQAMRDILYAVTGYHDFDQVD